MSNIFSAEERVLLDPDYYASKGYPFKSWAALRQNDPVHYVTDWNGPPYWALTRREEIIEVSKQPEIFSSMPRLAMGVGGEDPGALMVRTIIRMDPPEHNDYRSILKKRFTPRYLQSIIDQVDDIATEALDRIATGPQNTADMDFVTKVSAPIPIWVVAEMLGIPKSHWENMFNWTNEAVGASDPEYQKGRTEDETRNQAIAEMTAYFTELAESRRQNPRDDISSLLVNAEINGKKMDEFDLLSYFIIVLNAGNETTRNAISGGMYQLLRNPDQLSLLREKPELLENFVEETLRYVSPVIHMCREAKQDYVLGDKKIKKGDTLVMFYPSANRDETAFPDPDTFDISRPLVTPHLTFGIGEHFCLGNNIARMEIKALYQQLMKRLTHIELLEEPERLRMTSVGGIKHLRVRYSLT